MPRRLAIAVVVKDNARTAARFFRGVAGLSRSFDEISFAVYENNSSDGTKEELQRLTAELPSMRVASEDLSRERQEEIASVRHKDGRPCRIEILAYAREKVRTRVLDELGDHDFVLVADADAALFSFAGIVRAAEAIGEGRADCVTANGLTKRLLYRDAFALRSREHPIGPEFLGDYWREVVRKRVQARLAGRDPLSVYAAFGGAALYSMDAYRAGRYSAIPDEEFCARQRSLDVSEADTEELRRASPVPVASMNYLGPIVCEHTYFCYAMRGRGFGRILVDPRWRILFMD
jgi:hypothetical protein